MKDDYSDIINMKKPISKNPMPIENRAAQFAPFAALTGHAETISETARLTEDRISMSEDKVELINNKLKALYNRINSRPRAKITYFKKDSLKDGGAYITTEDNIYEFDFKDKKIITENKGDIKINDIYDIEIDFY